MTRALASALIRTPNSRSKGTYFRVETPLGEAGNPDFELEVSGSWAVHYQLTSKASLASLSESGTRAGERERERGRERAREAERNRLLGRQHCFAVTGLTLAELCLVDNECGLPPGA